MEELRRTFHQELEALRGEVLLLRASGIEAIPRATGVRLSGHLEGADYLVHGPVCATLKGDTRIAGIGFEALARGVARASVPVWALGGLAPEHARAAAEAGARGMAVLGGLLAHPQAERRTAEYVRAWLEAAPSA